MIAIWKKDNETGMKKIDQQHKEIHARLNQLINILNHNCSIERISDFVECLEEYTMSHFRMEEEYMIETKYPGYVSHSNLHTALFDSFFEIKDKINETQDEEDFIDIDFIFNSIKTYTKSLISHIDKEDKIMAKFSSPKRDAHISVVEKVSPKLCILN